MTCLCLRCVSFFSTSYTGSFKPTETKLWIWTVRNNHCPLPRIFWNVVVTEESQLVWKKWIPTGLITVACSDQNCLVENIRSSKLQQCEENNCDIDVTIDSQRDLCLPIVRFAGKTKVAVLVENTEDKSVKSGSFWRKRRNVGTMNMCSTNSAICCCWCCITAAHRIRMFFARTVEWRIIHSYTSQWRISLLPVRKSPSAKKENNALRCDTR